MLRQCAAQIEGTVYPAYDRLIAYTESILPRTTSDAGLWRVRDGRATYATILRWYTTTDMSAEQVHQTGLAEVEQIERDLAPLLDSLGAKGRTVGERLNALRMDRRFLYPETDSSRAQALADYERLISEADRRVGSAFGVKPKKPPVVRRMAVEREATKADYYMPGSQDGSRPGTFYANLGTLRPKWAMKALAAHEAVPGHHFQITIQQEMRGVPGFRRLISFSAFSEGWGLYAERQAAEMNLMSAPEDKVGLLESELLRAVRLVVDTGIHHYRWSREQAIAYMEEHLGATESKTGGGNDWRIEVERYIVRSRPGVRIQDRRIEDCRVAREGSQGARTAFSLASFHDSVLSNGAMPLEVLDRVIDAYIQRGGSVSN